MPLLVMVVIAAIVFFLVFKFTIGSIESLGTKISLFYPFEVRVQKPNTWTTVVFIIITAALTLLVILLSKGDLPNLPA